MNKKIILPTEDGVANLEIRRIQSEIEEQAHEEYEGAMPEEAQKRLISDLERCLEAMKRGGVSSIVLAYMGDNIHPLANGLASIVTESSETHMLMGTVMAALESRMGGPDDEAG